MQRPVLLVLGGSRGIGAATARLAASRGYDVAIAYKSNAQAAQGVADAVTAAGAKAALVQGELAQEGDIERAFAAAEQLGPVTHLVHSAGITGKNSRLDAVETSTIRDVLDINTFGALLTLRSAVLRMSTKHGGKGGSIVMLSSMAADLGGTNEYIWYAAAKGAVNSMTVGLAREVAKEGIRINAVSPGAIDTDIHEPGRLDRVMPFMPMDRAGKAEEVAETILFLLSDAASYITGAIVNVSGGR
jgi:NAD(P)-dependent dehydrogenase (short-subunit alcohol dehydrogenase family)